MQPEDCELELTPVNPPSTTSASSPAVVLGTETSDTASVTVTLTQAVPADGTLMVFFSTVDLGGDGDETQNVLSAADSQTVAGWVTATSGRAVIGLASDDTSSLGNPFHSLYVGSVGRVCTQADLGVGDTVTVTWSNIDGPGAFHVVAVVTYLPGDFSVSAVKQRTFVDYVNGDGYPSGSASNTTLSWATDVNTLFPPYQGPDEDALFIGAFASYPPSTGFAPLTGTVLTEVVGTSSLAITFGPVAADAQIDPGGTFGSAGDILVGNYQFIVPVAASGGGTGEDDDCDLELVPEDESCDLVLSPATARDIENPSTRGRITGTAGIASALTFGTGGAAQQVIGSATVGAVAGIVSAETFGVGGSASINTLLLGGNPGTGLVSATRFGVGGSIQRGTGLLVLRGNSGITAGGFGATGRTKMYLAGSAGIVSGAAFGTNALVSRTVGIRGTAGIVSALTFGTGGKAVLDVTGAAGIPAGSFGTGGAVFRPGATLIDNHMLLSLTWQA